MIQDRIAQNRSANNSTSVLVQKLIERGDITIEVKTASFEPDFNQLQDYHVLLAAVNKNVRLGQTTYRAITERIESGMGFVILAEAIHAFDDWPDREKILGIPKTCSTTSENTDIHHADERPEIPLTVLDPDHPAMLSLGGYWLLSGPIYPLGPCRPIGNLLIRTYKPLCNRPAPECIAWTREVGQGRVFVLACGQYSAVQPQDEFITLLHNAIRWAGKESHERNNTLTRSEMKAGYSLLFDGTSMEGWKGDQNHWQARDGQLIGRIESASESTLLTWPCATSDFVLKFNYKPVAGQGALLISGQDTDKMDEIPLCFPDSLIPEPGNSFRPDGWNMAVIRVKGQQITIQINDLAPVRLPRRSSIFAAPPSISWRLAGQSSAEIHLRNIRFQPLPRPLDETLQR